ncbi:hypothetical protein BMF89_21230 [Arthrobacter sp. SRS-W-1-2016]|nr:hypothetical protein BMF89_21230 [Arthrobacter sp. SRS-W-1-2016]
MDCLAALYAHLARHRGIQPQDIAIYQEIFTRKKSWFGGYGDSRDLVAHRDLVTTIRGWTFEPTDSYESPDLLIVDSSGAYGYANSWKTVSGGIVISHKDRVNQFLADIKGTRPGSGSSNVTSTTILSEVEKLLNNQ